MREIQPGEIVIADSEHGLRSERVELEGARPALCIFEFIYFARPGQRHERQDAARGAARRWAGTSPGGAGRGRPRHPGAGHGHAGGHRLRRRLRHPLRRGPHQEPLRAPHVHPARRAAAPGRHPHEAQPADARSSSGKRLVVVDDSIVRGNTTGSSSTCCSSAGAKEVHLRISSPPIQWPCFYGIDMATRAELIAANKTVDEIRDHVGATSLHYLTLDGLQASTGLPRRPVLPRLLRRRLPHRGARGVRDVQDALREGRDRRGLRGLSSVGRLRHAHSPRWSFQITPRPCSAFSRNQAPNTNPSTMMSTRLLRSSHSETRSSSPCDDSGASAA